ncbi:MAG: hypothetical protein JXA17_00100, partial [Dehalococcoidales bacterium]|nr:hypothetical protein [Dehalococcoidales bacterium]
LRIKLADALKQAPGNRRVLKEAARLLAKWYRSKYSMDKQYNLFFHKYIEGILEAIVEKSVVLAGTNRACNVQTNQKITERIEAENIDSPVF